MTMKNRHTIPDSSTRRRRHGGGCDCDTVGRSTVSGTTGSRCYKRRFGDATTTVTTFYPHVPFPTRHQQVIFL
jgi:hypothetical protein